MADVKITATANTDQAQQEFKELNTAVGGTGVAAAEAGQKLKAAGDETAKAGEQVKKLGDKQKEAKKDTDDLASAFKNMSSMELAGKIQEISGALNDLGKITEGVAENDIEKFRSGMESATRAAVNGVSLIAPQFAPVVAVLGVVIGKVAEWALGMANAEEVIKSMNAQLEIHNKTLDYSATLAKARAISSEEAFRAEQESLQKRIDINNQALRELIAADLLASEEGRKLNEKNEELRLQIRVNAIERQKALDKEAQDAAIAAADATASGIEHRYEEHAERMKEAAERKKEAFNTEVESLKESAEISVGIMDTLKQATDEMVQSDMAALGKEADERKRLADVATAAGKQQAAAAKQAAADQIKAAEDAQKRTVAAYTKMFDLIKLAVTDWKAALGQALDLITKAFLDSMLKQATAATTSAATVSAAQATQTAAFAGGQAAQSSAAVASIPPKVASFAASLGPFGLALAAGLISALLAIARQKIGFEEGTQGSVQDSIAGLGRNDRGAYGLSPKEGVINEDGMNTRIGDIVGAINRGFGQGQNGGRQAAVPAKIVVELVYRGLPERSIIRQLMNLFNIEVRQFNGDLEATRLFG